MAITTQQAVIKETASLKTQEFNISDHQVTFAFGSRYTLEDEDVIQKLLPQSSDNHVIMCSTSGQIADTLVYDDELVLTGISFEHTKIQIAKTNITNSEDSYKIGKLLASELAVENLAHVLIFSDGHIANGSELVKGFNEILKNNVKVTGGMAGDAARFERTLVGHNETPQLGNIVALGLYGDHRLEVAYGYSGGFDPFGPYRKITKSKGNVLYELDGKNALDLYKKYLGDLADELPGSALFFPLSITLPGSDIPLVRTILSVDEATSSMTFAGDVPEGCTARLMRSNIEHVVDAAEDAARKCLDGHTEKSAPQLAMLISCVGRKLILDQRIEEETEAVKDVLGGVTMTGFYSYGEICPSNTGANQYADLHNQTMTITTFSEL